MAVRRVALPFLALAIATTARAQGRDTSTTTRAARGDTLPAGFGSLRRDEIALTVQVQGLTVKAIPLDENVIRTLAPDSYSSLHAVRVSRAAAIDAVRKRLGLSSVQAWYVSFFNVQAGEARFDPRGMQLRSAGRDFRPLDVIALQPGFDDGRLAQGRNVDAIFVFDPAVVLTQPLVVTLAGVQNTDWSDGTSSVLSRLERERAAVWSRAATGRKAPGDSTKGRTPPW